MVENWVGFVAMCVSISVSLSKLLGGVCATNR